MQDTPKMDNNADDLLTPDEVADLWRCCSESVRALCRGGKLTHIRLLNRGIRIRRGDAVDYLNSRKRSAS